jgi:hypothetical protein
MILQNNYIIPAVLTAMQEVKNPKFRYAITERDGTTKVELSAYRNNPIWNKTVWFEKYHPADKILSNNEFIMEFINNFYIIEGV